MKTRFYITDVFGKEKYSGNQLATFIDAKDISSEEMQKIAFEIGFSETTFITGFNKNESCYDVRIFTPFEEVPFAGHPTLGTGFIINECFNPDRGKDILLNEKAGIILVTQRDGKLWMKQNQPQFFKQYTKQEMAGMLCLSEDDFDGEFPIEEVSTGLPMTILPLKSLVALKKAKVNHDLYEEFCKNANARPLFLFAKESYEADQDLAARMFAPCFGIQEDPATGSANGCFAAYLLKHNYFNSNVIDVKVGQGYEINRPSELHLQCSLHNSTYDINVGGLVIPVAEGEWYL